MLFRSQPESGLGHIRHESQLTDIYDASENPLKFKAPATWNGMNDFEKQVIDAGFAGYFTRQTQPGRPGKNQGRVVLLGDAAERVATQETEATNKAYFQGLHDAGIQDQETGEVDYDFDYEMRRGTTEKQKNLAKSVYADMVDWLVSRQNGTLVGLQMAEDFKKSGATSLLEIGRASCRERV